MTNDIPEEFLNVHDILQDAVLETKKDKDTLVPMSFRLSADLKILTESICRSNGTDASKFLRKCCETLVRDYGVETSEE